MYRADWKKELDKVYKETVKNWWKTGRPEKSNGINAQVSLGQGKEKGKQS